MPFQIGHSYGKRFKKGHIPWNKDKSGVMPIPWNKGVKQWKGKLHPRLGKKHTKETREKIKKALMGESHPSRGKKLSETHKRKIGEANKGNIPWLKGKKGVYSKETIEKLSESKKGKNNPAWRGGISFEPYGLEFNKKLKEQIRKRDNYTCQECGFTENQLGYKLRVHHIDYNKKNSEENNLISLCKSCHSQTNFGRMDWIKYFQEIQERRIQI